MALTPLRGTSPPTVNSVAQVNPGDRVSADKGEIAPIVAVLSRQLPLPQAQQLAGQTALVKVVKSGLGGQAELEFAGQNIAVKLPQGKMLTAGEMVTVSFALGEKIEGSNTTSNGKKILDSPSILNTLSLGADEEGEHAQSSSFVSHLSTAGRLIGFLDQLSKGQSPQTLAQTPHSIKQLSTQAQQDVQNGLSNNLSGLLAHEVSSAVENSGLFYESHLQQWALGKRSTDQLAQEPQSHFGPEQRIAEQSIDPAAIAQSAKLVNAQLATLDHSKIALNLQGLFGQPIEVEIEPDSESPEQTTTSDEAARPWSANLKLDMAHLGILQVRIRMVGSQCDVQISSSAESKKAIDPHWQEFEAAMRTHGLKLNHGQVSVADEIRQGGSVA